MTQEGLFTRDDFASMQTPGLENRMYAIRSQIQPKFQAIADHLLPFFNTYDAAQDSPFFLHIARHARRTVHPPDSTWMAVAQSKRGYKKYPHFQFGIWPDHLFFWLAVIEEYPDKVKLGQTLLEHVPQIQQSIPPYFAWSADHMKNIFTRHQNLNKDDLNKLFFRLEKVKKAELLCGVIISKEEATAKNENDLVSHLKEQIKILMPLYETACACEKTMVSEKKSR
ncbi:DUF1054 domain-containing protein [Sporolactobacillus sp. CPB3-1]|uniref:UPF0637 protein M3N64_03330 n=1 Tax=Sporolactobacillus mangiferae TaxID=2940498 RepID=A0ABT0M7X9_9BACL|nr:DUF1054 domain-containing protein [Sporolactobacillus mangiferae]MCL1630977.1 DUF1054 domain-containing protein [Sporolactobacillus mangiferae]